MDMGDIDGKEHDFYKKSKESKEFEKLCKENDFLEFLSEKFNKVNFMYEEMATFAFGSEKEAVDAWKEHIGTYINEEERR